MKTGAIRFARVAMAAAPIVLSACAARRPPVQVASAQHVDSDIRLVRPFPDLAPFDRPVCVVFPPGLPDRVFVAEQRGRVYSFPYSTAAASRERVLDISDRVEQELFAFGLFGMAFHPDARRNRRVFFHYTSPKKPMTGVISEFRLNKDFTTIDPSTERIVLEFDPMVGHHDGGGLEFGPDGFLYVAIGGGAVGFHPEVQSVENLHGKIIRIDVDRPQKGLSYGIPADNPFIGVSGARPEIWAMGFTRIWRFSFDRATGRLWAGDLGTSRWEEINVVEKGGNFGWNYFEGPEGIREEPPENSSFIPPFVAQPRSEMTSIIGGYVYRGDRFPRLRGTYIYGDNLSGTVWAVSADLGGKEERKPRKLAALPPPDGQPEVRPEITSFGEDLDGELFITAFDGRIFTFQ